MPMQGSILHTQTATPWNAQIAVLMIIRMVHIWGAHDYTQRARRRKPCFMDAHDDVVEQHMPCTPSPVCKIFMRAFMGAMWFLCKRAS